MTKYEVIRITRFMGINETELEATYNTEEEAQEHIKLAIQQEKNLGMPISQFAIKKGENK